MIYDSHHLAVITVSRYDSARWGWDKRAAFLTKKKEKKIKFLNKDSCILIQISLKSVLKGSVDKILALFGIMAWHWTNNKPLSEPMMA